MKPSKKPTQQRSEPSAPNFRNIVRQVISKWRQLPVDERNSRDNVEGILTENSSHLHLFPQDRDTLERRLNEALSKEGYTGKPLEALHETRASIRRCIRAGFLVET